MCYERDEPETVLDLASESKRTLYSHRSKQGDTTYKKRKRRWTRDAERKGA